MVRGNLKTLNRKPPFEDRLQITARLQVAEAFRLYRDPHNPMGPEDISEGAPLGKHRRRLPPTPWPSQEPPTRDENPKCARGLGEFREGTIRAPVKEKEQDAAETDQVPC